MPGDTLYMRDGLLYLNGIAQRQGFAAEQSAAAIRTRRRAELRLAAQVRAQELALRLGARAADARQLGTARRPAPITIS